MFRNLIFLFILLLGEEIFAQKSESNFFSLSDTVFKQNQIYRTYNIKFELAKWVFKSDSYPTLDSIAVFMKAHPSCKIEVGVHSDSRVNPKSSSSGLYQNRAQAIADYLIKLNVSKDRMIPKGWGDRKLLISDAEITKVKTKEEKEKLHSMNRRVELKIIGIN